MITNRVIAWLLVANMVLALVTIYRMADCLRW